MTPYDYEPRSRSRSSLVGYVLPFVLLLILLGLLVWWWGDFGGGGVHDPEAVPRAITARGELAGDELATIELFKAASPSVVHITSMATRPGVFLNDLEIPQGTGSGFIWSREGYVVTNYHVIQNAEAARVMLADGSVWDASLVGAAPASDLAVLKINAPEDRLPPIAVGTSVDLQVGQKVFAIGNPFGFDQTLTTGVISGLERQIMSDVTRRPISHVIQTDAAINPGNSGGPLLDSAGRLIGVNTAIYSPSGAYAGIGFAVPVDTVNDVVPQLIRGGRVERPGLGVQIASDIAMRRLGLRGVLVLDFVGESSAAERAGIRVTRINPETGEILQLGDRIIAIDGEPVESAEDLIALLADYDVGETVQVTVLRTDLRGRREVTRELTLPVTLQPVEVQ